MSQRANKTFKDDKGNFTINIGDIQFVEEYLANGYNATGAWRKLHPELKESSLNASACRALKKESVARYLDMRRKEIYGALNVDALRVAEELATVAFAVKGDADYNATSKLKALELLGKYVGMFDKKAEASNNQTIKVTIEE